MPFASEWRALREFEESEPDLRQHVVGAFSDSVGWVDRVDEKGDLDDLLSSGDRVREERAISFLGRTSVRRERGERVAALLTQYRRPGNRRGDY